MKPDKGDWLAIINVFAANGLGEACLSPFRLAVCAAENRSGKGEQAPMGSDLRGLASLWSSEPVPFSNQRIIRGRWQVAGETLNHG